MSIQIAIYREGRFSHFHKLKVVRRLISRGRLRWRNHNREAEVIESATVAPRQVYTDGRIKAVEWRPKPSGCVMVLQAKVLRHA